MFINYASASQVANVKAQGAAGFSFESLQDTFMRFIPMILICLVFYFLILRPQSKKRQEQERLIKSIQKGQEVLTYSGLYGKVAKVSDNIVELEVSPKVFIKIDKTSINQIIASEK